MMWMMRYNVELTKSQISNLIDFIEFEFIDTIRSDESIDNIDYLVDMMNALQILRSTYQTIDDNDNGVCSPYKDCCEEG